MSPINKRLSRKTHRYLALIVGAQLLLWTFSGAYFALNDIDEIRGSHFRANPEAIAFSDLITPSALTDIQSIELRNIAGQPHYWINGAELYHARSGELKQGISAPEAIAIATQNLRETLVLQHQEIIRHVNQHHEYRGRPLPAYQLIFEDDQASITAYVSIADGKFQTVRHDNWRIFDFLWMLHTMDYLSRDNFNNNLLRLVAVLAFLAIVSGFWLWSTSRRRARQRNQPAA